MYISIIMVETQLNISVNIIDLQIAYWFKRPGARGTSHCSAHYCVLHYVLMSLLIGDETENSMID